MVRRFSIGASRVACYYGHSMSPVERGPLHAFKDWLEGITGFLKMKKLRGAQSKLEGENFVPDREYLRKLAINARLRAILLLVRGQNLIRIMPDLTMWLL